jgi:type II secretory pathway pseudopilin PulG
MELLAALAVLSVVLGLISQLALLSTTLQGRSEMQRQAAQAASNFLEQATALPYAEIDESALQDLVRKRDSLPHELSATVRELPSTDEASVVAKQIRVVVQHEQFPGLRCELVGFKHRAREGEQP